MGRAMKVEVKRGFALGTNIDDIEVPAELEVKHSTGMSWIDDALGGEGGFTATSVMMLTGMPGAGKSTLLRQLASTMTKQGHVVVYNTGEESLYQAKMACRRLNATNFKVGEETELPKLIAYLDRLKAANPGKVIVLLQDSLQTLDDKHYSNGTTGNTPVRVTQELVNWAQENFGFVLFIGQCTKDGDFAGKNTIKHAIDVHAHLFYDEDKKSATYGCLLFEVQKNRWGCNGKTYIVGLTRQGLEERGSFTKSMDVELSSKQEAA